MAAPFGSRDQPGGRPPAPPPLDVVQDFLNTRNVEADVDLLTTPADLQRWFADRGLLAPDTAVRRRDLDDATALREALREILARPGDASPAAIADLRAIGARARFALDVGEGGTLRVTPAQQGVAGAFAELLARVLDAQQRGTLARLKICRNDGCRWAFFDRSRNARGTWCTMDLCGAQAKMREYRLRRAQR